MIPSRVREYRLRVLEATSRWKWFLLASVPVVVQDSTRFLETGWFSTSLAIVIALIVSLVAYVLVGRLAPLFAVAVAVCVGITFESGPAIVGHWVPTPSGEIVRTPGRHAGITVRGVELGRSVLSSWRLPQGVATVTFRFASELVEGPTGWDFLGNLGVNHIESVAMGNRFATIYSPPPASGAFISRRFETGYPVQNRAFVAHLAISSATYDQATGVISVSEPGGAQATQVVALVGTESREFDVVWHPTYPSTASAVDVVIAGFDMPVLVHDVQLYEVRSTSSERIGPPAPNGVGVFVQQESDCRTSGGACWIEVGRHLPIPAQVTYEYTIDASAIPEQRQLQLGVAVERNTSVALTELSLVAHMEDGTDLELRPVRRLPRQAFGLAEPNIAGDAFTGIGLVAINLLRESRLGFPLLSIVFLLILATGSRSSVVVLFVAGAVAAFAGHAGSGYQRRFRALIGVLAVLLVLAVLGYMRYGTLAFPSAEPPSWLIAREGAWRTAIAGIREDPLFGIGVDAKDYISSHHPGSGVIHVSHAHNIWLQAVLESGLSGFLCAGALTFTAVRAMFARCGSGRCAAVFGMLVLQMVDVTIAAVPVMTGLVALVEAPAAGPVCVKPRIDSRTSAAKWRES